MRADILQQTQAIRASMDAAAGGTVVLQYMLHELVGYYFVAVG